MKTIATTLMTLAVATLAMEAADSHVVINSLGSENTLVRLVNPEKYLILPVQESMPDSKIDILVDGNLVQTLYVRLADSKVDYSVPLDLTPYTSRGSVVLNIVSETGRTQSRNASEFVCWERMQSTDSFDASNREKYRPAFHHTPLYGWMNDPNGMFYKDGVWHLYYQYNPYGSRWQNLSWGHSTTRDLVHWEHEPHAIEPNGLGLVFSGSSVVDENNTSGFGDSTVVAIYTSAGRSQIQSLAYSHDNGKTFTFYPGNPVIANATEARDPNMFWHEPTGKWVLTLAHALDKEMQFYTSPNLIDWTLQSSFGYGYGSQDGVWECPDLFELPVEGTDLKKWVLICNINPGSPMGGSGTQYFTGDFDGKIFTPDESKEVQKWMDHGKDHYATVTWSNAPDNRRTAIGWMSNWQYANDVPTRQFRSANTLPRDLGLFRAPDGKIYLSSRPAPEVECLRGNMKKYGNATVGKKSRHYAIPALAEILVDYDAGNCDRLDFTLSNNHDEKVVISIDPREMTVTADRTKSGITDFSQHFPAATSAPILRENAKGQLRIFIDKCSVEIFDGEGRFVITDLVFPENPYSTMTVSTAGGKAKISNVKVYDLKSL